MLLTAASARADEYRLSNGLRVVLADDPSVGNVSIAVSYEVGAADDPVQYRGLAHLLEHVTFRDARHPDSYHAMDLIEAAGGGANAMTSSDRTVYYAVLPRSALELGLWIESERMAFALAHMDERALQLEQKIVANELAMRENTLGFRMNAQRDRSLYGLSHPYALQDDTERDAVMDVTLPGLQWFFQHHYRPDNATLVIVGAFDKEQARQFIERYFAPIKNPQLPHVALEPPAPKQCGVHRVELTHYFLLGRYLSVTWAVPPPRSAAEVLSLRALEVMLETRLKERLVQGSYDAASAPVYVDHRKTHSLLEVQLELRNAADFAKVESRLMVVVSELARTQLSEQELRSLRLLLTTEAVLAREDGLRRALAITSGFDNVHDAELAAGLTAASVYQAAERLLRERLVLRVRAKDSQSQIVSVADEADPCH